MRILAPLAGLLAALLPTSYAQSDLTTAQGNSRGNNFGYTVANAGDVDGDGFDDVAVGTPFDNSPSLDAGRVRVYSGKDGSQVLTVGGLAPGDQFGYSVAAIFDVNFDGFDDLAVGAPFADPNGTSSGQVRIISGANGGTIATLNGPAAGDRFGWSVAYAGSVAFLGRVVIGAPNAAGGGTDRGSAHLYTGTGGFLHTWNGTQSNEHFGYAVGGGFDTNSDGVHDVVIGCPDFDDGGADTGRARVYSAGGAFGLLQTQPGAGPGHRFGHAVAMLGDVNNDGEADYIVGAPEFVGGQGAAYVHSGATGAILYTKTGNSVDDHFGWSVARAGDPNNDLRADFIVGAPDDTNNGPSGSAVLYSGSNGAVLRTFASTLAGGQYGRSVGGGGDLNSDGREDLIVGAPYADVVGVDAGNVKAYSGNGYGQLLNVDGAVTGDALGQAVCSLDVNNDGFSDLLVGAHEDDHTTFIIISSVTEESAGSVRAISGANGATLWTIWGDSEGDELGFSLASLGADLNSDGIHDFVVGAPQRDNGGPGYARVCSGANGATIFTVSGVAGFDSEFGYAVARGGKLNGDFVTDVVIGCPGYDNDRGRVVLVNGFGGGVIADPAAFGLIAGERFGAAVASLDDVNNDGLADFVVGAPSNDSVASNAGRVYGIEGGAGGVVLFTLSGTTANESFGTAVCALKSMDGDAKNDFVVGAPGYDAPTATDGGFARLYFTATLTEYWTVFGNTNDHLGGSLANIGDFNLDGFEDVAAGGSEFSIFFSGTGLVRIISGYYGFTLYDLHSGSSGDDFGSAVAAAGDFNADGSLDVAIGAPAADPSGPSSGVAKVMSIHPVGIGDYGSGSPGCLGSHQLRANTPPKIGTSFFQLSSDNVPAFSLGLLLLANAQDVVGSDPLALGALFHVDLFASTLLEGFNMGGTQFNTGLAIVPIPLSPPIVGVTIYAQSLWVWNTCVLPSPIGLSSSEGLTITFQN